MSVHLLTMNTARKPMTMKLQRREKMSTGLFWSSSCWFSPILYSMTRIAARNPTAMAERQRRSHVGINTICGGEGEREIRGWATNGSVEMLSMSVMGCTSGKGRVNLTTVWLLVPARHRYGLLCPNLGRPKMAA